MKPIEPPWQAIKEWIPDDEPDLDWAAQFFFCKIF
jgi:hypothetical protein